MCTLKVYNKAETEMLQARNLEELMKVARWLQKHFEEHPEDRELIRDDLGKIFIRRKRELTPPAEKQARIYIKQWFARKIGTPRELQVTIKHETEKAYLIKGHALATPTSTCRHCGRRLTHPVSVLYGIGPECGKHYHIPQHPEDVEAIRKMIEQIEYEGWIPKSVVEVFEEVGI